MASDDLFSVEQRFVRYQCLTAAPPIAGMVMSLALALELVSEHMRHAAANACRPPGSLAEQSVDKPTQLKARV